MNSGDAHVLGQLHIGEAIADHIAVGVIELARLQPGFDQAEFRLAAGALLMGEVRADQHLLPVDALGFEDVHHQILRRLEVLQRQAAGAQTILIGDHDELETGGLQLAQHRDDHGLEAQLVEAIDLLVDDGLLDQGAVAVDE